MVVVFLEGLVINVALELTRCRIRIPVLSAHAPRIPLQLVPQLTKLKSEAPRPLNPIL
jgi:hypothetical protein